jgi:hypothetical protein
VKARPVQDDSEDEAPPAKPKMPSVKTTAKTAVHSVKKDVPEDSEDEEPPAKPSFSTRSASEASSKSSSSTKAPASRFDRSSSSGSKTVAKIAIPPPPQDDSDEEEALPSPPPSKPLSSHKATKVSTVKAPIDDSESDDEEGQLYDLDSSATSLVAPKSGAVLVDTIRLKKLSTEIKEDRVMYLRNQLLSIRDEIETLSASNNAQFNAQFAQIQLAGASQSSAISLSDV